MGKNILIIIIAFFVAIITGTFGIYGGHLISKHFAKKINKENCKKFIDSTSSTDCEEPNKTNCQDYCNTECKPANKTNCKKFTKGMISVNDCPPVNKKNCKKFIKSNIQDTQKLLTNGSTTIGNTVFLKNYQNFVGGTYSTDNYVGKNTNGYLDDKEKKQLKEAADTFCQLAGFKGGQTLKGFKDGTQDGKFNFQNETYFLDYTGYVEEGVAHGNISSQRPNWVACKIK